MSKIAIVGHAQEKFNTVTERATRLIIRKILSEAINPVLVSGHSPMGGVDIYAEEIATELSIPMEIYKPRNNTWEGGFKDRNIEIANACDEIHVIVVKDYLTNFAGLRHEACYHCKCARPEHIKSGGCWTGNRALKQGKRTTWWVVEGDGDYEGHKYIPLG